MTTTKTKTEKVNFKPTLLFKKNKLQKIKFEGYEKKFTKNWAFLVFQETYSLDPFTIDIDGPEDSINKVFESFGQLSEGLADGSSLESLLELLDGNLSVLKQESLQLSSKSNKFTTR